MNDQKWKPYSTIKEYDVAFEKWWKRVQELSTRNGVVDLSKSLPYSPECRYMDVYGSFDEGCTEEQFIVDIQPDDTLDVCEVV